LICQRSAARFGEQTPRVAVLCSGEAASHGPWGSNFPPTAPVAMRRCFDRRAAPQWALRVLGARELGHRRTVLPEQARSVARERVGASARVYYQGARVHGSRARRAYTQPRAHIRMHIECNAANDVDTRTCARCKLCAAPAQCAHAWQYAPTASGVIFSEKIFWVEHCFEVDVGKPQTPGTKSTDDTRCLSKSSK